MTTRTKANKNDFIISYYLEQVEFIIIKYPIVV